MHFSLSSISLSLSLSSKPPWLDHHHQAKLNSLLYLYCHHHSQWWLACSLQPLNSLSPLQSHHGQTHYHQARPDSLLSLSPPPLTVVASLACLFSPTPKLSLFSSKPPWLDPPSLSHYGWTRCSLLQPITRVAMDSSIFIFRFGGFVLVLWIYGLICVYVFGLIWFLLIRVYGFDLISIDVGGRFLLMWVAGGVVGGVAVVGLWVWLRWCYESDLKVLGLGGGYVVDDGGAIMVLLMMVVAWRVVDNGGGLCCW